LGGGGNQLRGVIAVVGAEEVERVEGGHGSSDGGAGRGGCSGVARHLMKGLDASTSSFAGRVGPPLE